MYTARGRPSYPQSDITISVSRFARIRILISHRRRRSCPLFHRFSRPPTLPPYPPKPRPPLFHPSIDNGCMDGSSSASTPLRPSRLAASVCRQLILMRPEATGESAGFPSRRLGMSPAHFLSAPPTRAAGQVTAPLVSCLRTRTACIWADQDRSGTPSATDIIIVLLLQHHYYNIWADQDRSRTPDMIITQLLLR